MPTFDVEWTIDIEADTAEQAARKALEIQRDPASLATWFIVTRLRERPSDNYHPERIDLAEIDEARAAQ